MGGTKRVHNQFAFLGAGKGKGLGRSSRFHCSGDNGLTPHDGLENAIKLKNGTNQLGGPNQ